MIKKKLLIAGGSYADIPLILSAQKMGYHVITSGNRANDLGHTYSDEYRPADFSDRVAILNLAKELRVDAVCACCNDFSALSCAFTAEKLGLPGHDTLHIAEIIHHKDKYRQFASENNIPTPKAMGFNNARDAINEVDSYAFPIIIKPVDLTGGKGISVINTKQEAESALNKAFIVSKVKIVVVEEFIVGSRHGFSAFLYKEKVIFYFSDNEHYYLNPFLVSAASSPSIVPKIVEQKLCFESEKLASLLSLKDGILHIQYILKDGEPIIIEICRRAPGDLYIKLVEYVTGVDYSAWIIKAALGDDCSDLKHIEPKGFFTRHCVMSDKIGIIQDVVFDVSIEKNIIDKFMWWKKGDQITDFLTAKFGIVFLKFDSMEEMISKTNALNELIHIEIEKSE